MKFDLSPDGRTVRLTIDSKLNAEDLESLISDLALLRGKLNPEVPRECPNLQSSRDVRVSTQSDPDFQLRLLRDGGIRLWIRNRGLGWLVFDFPVSNACAMRDYLVANTPAEVDQAGFFDGDLPGGGSSH